MDPQFEELAREIVRRVDARLEEFHGRNEHRLQVHFERTSTLVKEAAEGYGGTLESIDRRLSRLEKKWEKNFANHTGILANHNQRLGELEKARPRRKPRADSR